MRKSCVLLLLSTVTVPAFGSLSFLTSPLAATDSVNWSNIGSDGTLFPNSQTVTSTLGNVTTIGLGTQPALGGLLSVVCPAINPVNCSWSHQPSGYQDGDSLLWMEGLDSNGNPVGTGPLTLSLTSVGGLGAYIQATSAGPFNATLDVYHGASLLGSHSYTSDSTGDPLFLGAADSVAEINRAVFTVTACGSFDCDSHDFTMDTLQIFATPEPSSLALSGAMLAFGFAARKFLGGEK